MGSDLSACMYVYRMYADIGIGSGLQGLVRGRNKENKLRLDAPLLWLGLLLLHLLQVLQCCTSCWVGRAYAGGRGPSWLSHC